MGRQAQTSYSKALENERIAAATNAINTNISSGWKTLSLSLGGFVRGGATLPQSAPPAESLNEQGGAAPRSAPPKSGIQQQHSATGDNAAPLAGKEKTAKFKAAEHGDPFTLGDEEEEPSAKK